MTYQGWTNYETWAIALWMDNEEPLYALTRELARSAAKKEHGQYELADTLKNLVENISPNLGTSMFSDLLTHAIDQANYDEIAASLLEEVKE